MEDFRIKYRPQNMSEIWGNDQIKKRWAGYLKEKSPPKSIILHGNYGAGKTTLARILGEDILRVRDNNFGLSYGFYELDSTKFDSESVRGFLSKIVGFVHGTVVLFFDEFQRMPLKAQEILLKPIEQDGELFCIFATTNMESVDGGIQSRSTKFIITNPPKIILVEKLTEIAGKEGIKIAEKALEFLIEESGYSPRECLGSLHSLLGFDGEIDRNYIHQFLKPD